MMATVLRLDATLHAELSADIQKELNMELNRLRVGQRIKDAESAKVDLTESLMIRVARITPQFLKASDFI